MEIVCGLQLKSKSAFKVRPGSGTLKKHERWGLEWQSLKALGLVALGAGAFLFLNLDQKRLMQREPVFL